MDENQKQLTVGSLFSGIGGLELGLERTGGFRTIWQCEIDAYASAVLKKHWSNAPNLGDITKVKWEDVTKPDLICGGFPCQDISVAGKGAGIIYGTRSGLWREFAKAIRALRPRYALIENVPMLANRGLNIVLADLAEAGYDAEWHNISAASVGAWHKRERIFIIAHLHGIGGGARQKPECKRTETALCGGEPTNLPNTDGAGQLREKQLENSSGGARREGENDKDVSDTNQGRLERAEAQGGQWQGHNALRDSGKSNEIPDIEQLVARCYRRNKQGIWAAEPGVGRVANGVPSRVDRIKCLGNAVVPQVAQVVGEMILEMEKNPTKR